MVPKDLDIDVTIIDEQVEPVDLDMDCDVVVFSVTTLIARKCYSLADAFRERGKTVIMGGYHVTLCPDEAKAHADSIAVGEAEAVWPTMLRDLCTGRLKPEYLSSGPVDIKDMPVPRRDLLKMRKYIVPNTVIVTRGCPYMCSYCASSKIFGKFRRRDPDAVIREIRSLRRKNWREKLIMFVDDELFGNPEEAIRFFRKLKRLDLFWWSQATVPALFNRKLMEAAAESGCVGLMVGVETFNPETRKHIKKYQNYNRGLNEAVEYANSLGISVGAMMISGLDTDTPKTLKKTIQILKHSRFPLVNFGVLRPYPTMSTYQDLDVEGRVKKDWWMNGLDYGDSFNSFLPDYLKVYYTPKYFSPGELQEKTLEAFLKINSLLNWNQVKNMARLFYFNQSKMFAFRIFFATIIMDIDAWSMLRKVRKARRSS
ncbi:TPA: B12-binding domain-containing radical SAM protein [Candidatus Woesearchaeota archaeon]|nr:B12-binding domain-containing radical SAM protein [Candidatus Woesearchaeota archaeon]